jgi:bifunctional non-homologous end joining protein LigD
MVVKARRRIGETAGTRTAYPGFVEPCLATLRPAVPDGDGWVHEIKHDGYRTQAHLRGGAVRIFTRRGHDWTRSFGAIADALKGLPADELILDGEIIVQDEHGVSDFSALQSELARRRSDRLTYYVFDLLYRDGEDLRLLPLLDRKAALATLLAGTRPPIAYSAHLEGEGGEMFRRACAMRLEGVISKRRDAPYRSGRVESWIKTKCSKRDSFPIVAFVEKLGASPRRIASLYLGRWEGWRLLYAGKVRSGYSLEAAQHLRERLDPLITPHSPLAVPVRKPKATWVRPDLEADVTFSSLTTDGLLREPVFKGLAGPDRSEPAPRRPHPRSLGVPRVNILQLLPDAVVPAADELEAYWRRVGRRALRYIGRRPLKLVRQVNGTTFYHKGPLPAVPASVHQLRIEKREGGEGTRLWVDDVAGLLGLVSIGVVEVHPWNATIEDVEHPDQLVFDLDPGIEWQFVVDTALLLRDALDASDLDSWPKVTGGKGIHLMVPIEPSLTHDEVHDFARELAEKVSNTDRRYTTSAVMSQRQGRLFIDYLRNGRGTTAVGAYSPRARPGVPVAAPVTWAEVKRGMRPDAFTLSKPPGRR